MRASRLLAPFAFPLFLLICSATVAFGQYEAPTATMNGIPPHQALDAHQYDTINLSDLGTTITIPIIDKKGPIPFSYALRQQTYVGGFYGSDPCLQGTCGRTGYTTLGGRFLRGIPLFTPFSLSYGQYYSGITWSYASAGGGGCGALYNFQLVDSDGGSHPFPQSVALSSCQSSTATGAALDGSGYTLVASHGSNGYVMTVYDIAGNVANNASGLFIGSISDPNGNTISSPAPTSHYPYVQTWTDTTGNAVLTSQISYGNLPTDTYTYTDGSGHQATYTVNWTPLTADYGALTKLPTSVSLPDGTSFTFTYEPLTSPPYGDPDTTTGRIASITLPTGGTITYAYQSNNPDGTPALMTRTTADGTWMYSHAMQTSTTQQSTTVTDPLGNQKVYTFGPVCIAAISGGCNFPYPFYLVQKQVYNGSVSPSNLSLTEIHCYNGHLYNGNLSNCTPTYSNPISLPLTQADVYTMLPGVANPSQKEVFYNAVGMVV